MWETDDRIVGDPVWELFQAPEPAYRPRPRLRWGVALAVAGMGLWLWPVLSVVSLCVAVAWDDFVKGRQARFRIPDPAAARVSARFSYGWAWFKVGMTAFGMMFVTIYAQMLASPEGRNGQQPPMAFVVSALVWVGACVTSAALTGSGLAAAIRGGMRVWIGEGVNRARTLLLAMLITGFVFVVLIPLSLLLAARGNVRSGGPGAPAPAEAVLVSLTFMGIMFAGPVALLLTLDAIAKRVIADTPTKFGPKVAAVGKWKKPPVADPNHLPA